MANKTNNPSSTTPSKATVTSTSLSNTILPIENKLVSLLQSTKKIKEYTPDELKTLSTRMVAICKFIGTSSMPDEQSWKWLIQFIQRRWGSLSGEEIEQAFMMAVGFELDLQPKQVESLSISVLRPSEVSMVLQSYLRSRSKAVMKLEKLSTKTSDTQRRKEALENEDIKMRSASIKWFNNFRQDRTIDLPFVIYEWLREKNIISLDQIDVEGIRQKAKLQIKLRKSSAKQFSTVKGKTILEGLNSKETFRIVCAQLALKSYFNQLIKQNIDIENVLEQNVKER